MSTAGTPLTDPVRVARFAPRLTKGSSPCEAERDASTTTARKAVPCDRLLADRGVTNMPAPYTGGCQCGSVRYVLTTEPIRLAACHCKECQRQSGSAFGMSMPVKKDSLTVTGLTKQVTRIADSGNEVMRVFCPECR